MGSPLLLCSELDTSAAISACSRYSLLYDGTTCNRSYDGDVPWADCDCFAINPAYNQTHTIERIDQWEVDQARSQLIISLLSLILGGAYMLLFFVDGDLRMWRYPQNLAFWIYACDFVKSLSLFLVSFNMVYHAKARLDAKAMGEFVITWHSDCLCALTTADKHPGCSCENGVLALMLQGGLVGSVAFYCAMTHNFYSSVRDPFTKPESRLCLYHIVCWGLTVALTFPYALPFEGVGSIPGLSGSGYRAGYLACWFASRRATPTWDIDNMQLFVTVTLPIALVWVVTPILYLLARRELSHEGLQEMRAPRAKQLRYGDVLVRIFIVYFFLTGISFMLASYASDQPGGGCDNYELSLALQLANPGHSCDRIGGPAWSKFFFSTLLCLQVMGADCHCSPLIVPDRRCRR